MFILINKCKCLTLYSKLLARQNNLKYFQINLLFSPICSSSCLSQCKPLDMHDRPYSLVLVPQNLFLHLLELQQADSMKLGEETFSEYTAEPRKFISWWLYIVL